MGLKRVLQTITLFVLILTSVSNPPQVHAQTEIPPQQVRQLFEKMTPEERVGQLFLVTFTGKDTGNQSQIYDLIVNHHIGGVVLLSGNNNFVAAPNTIAGTFQLTQNLQQIEWEGASNSTGQSSYIPLFIGISQDGDGGSGDQILNGLTPLPSEMAIGATWSPSLANQVGAVMGHELSMLGFNLYFGPSLDVVEAPQTSTSSDLGSSVFGGDPYWVSVLGSAYISGLHSGSGNRLLVIAKHFPGRGSADRPSEEEVPTVRKSLEELKQIDLFPFFSVTSSTTSNSIADGLLLSHIRYQGFQGNIRATTRPVSFDPQALSAILSLPQFSAWTGNGGLIISDDLGTRAVRQFYSASSGYSAKAVARDAFVAGNDMLYLGNITGNDSPDNYSTVLGVLDFFSQKYREDPAFAQRVDASVLRILLAKNRLFGPFDVHTVLSSSSALDVIGQSEEITFNVARRAATLVSPDPQDLATLLPSPPQVRDRLIFFTDSSIIRQCSDCPDQAAFAVDALQNTIVRLYGPQSGNQTSAFRLSSYSLNDLNNYMANNPPPYLENDLGRAGWVILSLTDSSRGQPQLISKFLSDKQDVLRDKRVILFVFGAPYYLDATDISRLTAYYALYSKQPPFVEVAARLLYQELTPTGASPVSIPSLGYDLISATAPDPNQIITLSLDLAPAPVTPNAPTPEATPVPLFKIGDTIAIRTGVINDHNGHPVPDGTVVHFSMVLTGEGGGILQQADAVTTQGVARVSFGLDKPGLLQIRASSDPAVVSEVLQLDVSSVGQPAAVTVIVPALTPESEPKTPQTPQPSQDEFVTAQGAPRFTAWLLTILLLLASAAFIFLAGYRIEGARWGLRWSLCSLAGGLIAYNYLALGLPGSADFAVSNGIGGILLSTFVGVLAGWGGAYFWFRRAKT